MTLVPLNLYFNDRGLAKLQIGLAKGRRKQHKRQAAKDRDEAGEGAAVARQGLTPRTRPISSSAMRPCRG